VNIHLLRHPAPAVVPGVCYGQTDLALSQPPGDAAARLRPLLPGQFRLISSPLERCRRLGEALSGQIELDPRLMEMHFGDWENRPWDQVPRPELDAWAAAPVDFVPPGGESAAAMAERVIAFADDLPALQSSGELVVVAHQGPLRVLLSHWLALPRESWLKLPFDFAASTCIACSPQGNRLLWHNR
jgi:alpha-ribazole phosphatase